MAATYLMHGPDIDTGKVIQDYIPAENVKAMKDAGWLSGPVPVVEPDAEPLVIFTDEPAPAAVKYTTMHGPEIQVAAGDVPAYQAAGWVLGAAPVGAVVEAVEAEAPAAKKHAKK